MDNFSKPSLIEPGVKYFLRETLKQCKDFKDKYSETLTNFRVKPENKPLLGRIDQLLSEEE